MPSSRRSMLLLLVLSGTIISTSLGLRQSLGLFLQPMTVDFGISAATFGFAIALQNLVWGVSQPFVGALADRHGPRPVLVGTALVYALGLALMVFANRIPAGLEIAGFLAGIGVAGTGFGVLIGTVSRATPPERRTQTVGLVAAAGSLGTMVIAPAGQGLIHAFGWQAAMLAFAALAASMVLLALLIRVPSSGPGAAAAGKPDLGDAIRTALAHRGYVSMTVAFFACGFQLVFIASYLPSYLDICGVSPAIGATALALIGLFNAIGTYAFGLLGARYSQKRLLALIYLLRTLFIGAFLLLPVTPATTLVFASAMGLLWLGVVPLVTGIIGRMFGMSAFNTLYGVAFFSHQVGSFAGAWMGGVVFDRMGNYDLAWGALIAIGVTAFLLQWTMDERPPRRSAAVAATA
ncbi:MAG: MFS transporter [Burkholderiales bacterium]|nr:MFS transporter [Burkholderiales bacterium]